jgi:hypothetical protein
MQACVRAVLRMFDVQRFALPQPLRLVCRECEGIGVFIRPAPGCQERSFCPACKGHGYIDG